jgi:ferredoxin
MRIFVDPDLCKGCGICESIAPDIFELNAEFQAKVICDPIPEQFREVVEETIAECPEIAIIITEA